MGIYSLILILVLVLYQGCSKIEYHKDSKLVDVVNFDDTYQSKYSDQITIEIPEVYELLNIIISLTAISDDYPGMIYKNSLYYKDVLSHYIKFRSLPIVKKLNDLIVNNSAYYTSLKMDSFSYYFDEDGRIHRKKEFRITGFASFNTLDQFVNDLNDFSMRTGFLGFYKKNKDAYEVLIKDYREELKILEMVSWLERGFSHKGAFKHYRILLSPLSYRWQSSKSFRDNGFSELHLHINTPLYDRSSGLKISNQSKRVVRGDILFTEINHGYIDIELETLNYFVEKIKFNDKLWIDSSKSASSYKGKYILHEYLNWGLVALRYVSIADRRDFEVLLNNLEGFMQKRGFLKFESYNRYLLKEYKSNRDLKNIVKKTVDWFYLHNKDRGD